MASSMVFTQAIGSCVKEEVLQKAPGQVAAYASRASGSPRPEKPATNYALLGVLDFLYMTVCTTVSLLFFACVYLASFTWLLQFTGNARIVSAHRYLSVFLLAHLFLFKTNYEKHFNRSKVVFVVYPPERMWREMCTMPRLIRWFFSEPNFVIGNLYWSGAKVGSIVMLPPLSAIESPDALQNHLEWVLDIFKGATIALSGRLPSVCSEMSLDIASDPRIVDGRVGTVALGRKGAQSGLEWLCKMVPKAKSKGSFRLCVLGGGGYTGKEIGRACKDIFSEVYLVDSKFDYSAAPVGAEGGGASVIGTSNPCYVERADVVLVFLPSGELVEPYINFAHRKQVWIDDTHPPIPPSSRQELSSVTNLFRLTARSVDMGMFPTLPNWRPQDLPGCLLTAVAVAMNPEEFKTEIPRMCNKGGVNGIKDFIRVALGMGIELGMFPIEQEEKFKVLNMSIIPDTE